MAHEAINPPLDIQPVVDWLIEGARPSRQPREVLLDTCRRTVAAGLPIYRVGVFVRTLHPNLLGRAFIWQADKGAVEMTEAAHDLLESEAFLKSPIRVVFTEHVEVRRRLADASCPMDFPILEELRRDGATDFIAALPDGRNRHPRGRRDPRNTTPPNRVGFGSGPKTPTAFRQRGTKRGKLPSNLLDLASHAKQRSQPDQKVDRYRSTCSPTGSRRTKCDPPTERRPRCGRLRRAVCAA